MPRVWVVCCRDRAQSIGQRGRRYVERHYNLEAVAAKKALSRHGEFPQRRKRTASASHEQAQLYQ